MIDLLKSIDKKWLLAVNGNHTENLDTLMWFLSNMIAWIPFYIFIIIVLFIKLKKEAIPLILLVGLLILCSDQLASGIFKPLFHRLRPSHNPQIENLLHYVNNYRGGQFGFVSSHAINVFSLSFYLFFSIKNNIRWLSVTLFTWAIAVSFSRIYLGVHYPSDVIVPVFLSAGLGYAFSRFYDFVIKKYYLKTSSIISTHE